MALRWCCYYYYSLAAAFIIPASSFAVVSVVLQASRFKLVKPIFVTIITLLVLRYWGPALRRRLVNNYYNNKNKKIKNNDDDNNNNNNESELKGWLPEGSLGWPFVGETMQFLRPRSALSQGCFMETHRSRYGDVFKSGLFGHPTIVSADPDLNRFVLEKEGSLFQSSYPRSIGRILGQWSMLVLSGDAHKRMRAVATHFLGFTRMHHVIADVDRNARRLILNWEDGALVFAQSEARKFTFNLMASLVLSLQPEEPNAQRLLHHYQNFMKGVVSMPLNFPGTAYYKALKSRDHILGLLEELIRCRESNPAKENPDFLALLTHKYVEFSMEQRLDLVLNLLFAGYETSSVALALAIHFLAHSPKAVAQLREEHEAIRTGNEEEMTVEMYKRMEFTHCVIDETLRLGNVVRFLHRKAVRNITFKGYFIPKGWKVLPVFDALHLDPRLYSRPLEFDPWRWQPGRVGSRKEAYFTPFGGGKRLCAGLDLAKMEICIFLHYLVLHYEWTPSEPDEAYAFPFVEFKKGLPIRLKRITK